MGLMNYTSVQYRGLLGDRAADGCVVALVRWVVEETGGVAREGALRLDSVDRGDVPVVRPDLHDVAGVDHKGPWLRGDIVPPAVALLEDLQRLMPPSLSTTPCIVGIWYYTST